MSTEHLLPGYLAARDRLLARKQRIESALQLIAIADAGQVQAHEFRTLSPAAQSEQIARLQRKVSEVDLCLEGRAS